MRLPSESGPEPGVSPGDGGVSGAASSSHKENHNKPFGFRNITSPFNRRRRNNTLGTGTDTTSNVRDRKSQASAPAPPPAPATGYVPRSDGGPWWRIRLFRGMVNDIRRRAPYYLSDWTDAWNYRVVPATVYMYFAKYVVRFLSSPFSLPPFHRILKNLPTLTSINWSIASSRPWPFPSTCFPRRTCSTA